MVITTNVVPTNYTFNDIHTRCDPWAQFHFPIATIRNPPTRIHKQTYRDRHKTGAHKKIIFCYIPENGMDGDGRNSFRGKKNNVTHLLRDQKGQGKKGYSLTVHRSHNAIATSPKNLIEKRKKNDPKAS